MTDFVIGHALGVPQSHPARLRARPADYAGYTIDFDGMPHIPDGWTLKSHDPDGRWEFNPDEIELYLSENQRVGRRPDCTSLYEELKGAPVFNANLLDFFVDIPEFVPEEFDELTLNEPTRVLFPGTEYATQVGRRMFRLFRSLRRDPVTGWWGWSFEWFHPENPLPRGLRIAMRRC